MRVVFRTDASLQIGTGHVVRCLTLAEALRKYGFDIVFVSRKNTGNLQEKITNSGFHFFELEVLQDPQVNNKLQYGDWLTVGQKQDAEQCKRILRSLKPDWLVVDHYSLDIEWETELRAHCKYLMVIDDLADRVHDCDLLLDQTYGREQADYAGLTPRNCSLLTGSAHSLLRPEFSEWRPYSIERRSKAEFRNLLISVGGVDVNNHTEAIIVELDRCSFPREINIVIVLGKNCPHRAVIEKRAASSKHKIDILVDVENMAEIMANSDVAIGAAGTTSWERCCLGLPSIQIVLADNQKFVAEKLEESNACLTVTNIEQIGSMLSSTSSWITNVSESAIKVTDGTGARKVAHEMAVAGTTFELAEVGVIETINYTRLADDDLMLALNMRNSPEVRRWMYSKSEISRREHLSFIDGLKQKHDRSYFLVLVEGVVAGSINFSNIIENESLYFGLFANPFADLKRPGKVLEAAGAHHAFKLMNVKKIMLEVFSDNSRAIKFYEKSGFKLIEEAQRRGKSILLMEKSKDDI